MMAMLKQESFGYAAEDVWIMDAIYSDTQSTDNNISIVAK